MNSTIAAISTAQGAGGIGIIRISGSEAINIADKVFSSFSKKKLCDTEGYRALYGNIKRNGEVLDECVALVFRAPKSFTGENVVELCCHGGNIATKLVLRTVLENGAVPAQPGEFTRRAFENGKMDLAEAESVMNLINAQSQSALKAAVEVRGGAVSRKIDEICESLEHTAAHLSAWADYPEEDIPEVSAEHLENVLNECSEKIIKLIKNYDAGKAVTQGIPTVILGKPNVGKSTLMNLLSGYDKSIVTDIPGTTRDIVEETVVLGDVILRLSDTAGIRNTDNIVEKIGVDRAKQQLDASQLVLAVFDSSGELEEEDKEILDRIENIPAVAVINKSDLTNKLNTEYIKNKIKHIVYISAKKGEGKEELISAVSAVTGANSFDPASALLAGERQRAAAQNASDSIKGAIDALNMGYSLDAVTVDIEEALQHLYELVGKNVSEEVVNRVFHNFCVGK